MGKYLHQERENSQVCVEACESASRETPCQDMQSHIFTEPERRGSRIQTMTEVQFGPFRYGGSEPSSFQRDNGIRSELLGSSTVQG